MKLPLLAFLLFIPSLNGMDPPTVLVASLDLTELQEKLEQELAAERMNYFKKQEDELCELIEHKNPRLMTRYGTTLLHLAAYFGLKELCEELLKSGAVVDARKEVVYEDVIYRGREKIGFTATALIYACRENHRDIAELLLAHGADINAQEYEVDERNQYGYTPLHRAVVERNTVLLKFLIAQGADCTVKGEWRTPLHEAARNGDTECAALLIENGASPHDDRSIFNQTPLHEAVAEGHKEMVPFLIDKGADINAVTQDRFNIKATPLLIALSGGTLKLNSSPLAEQWRETVKVLIELGAEVNLRNPLTVAVMKGDGKLATLLIAKGADVNNAAYTPSIRRPLQHPPLHTAVMYNEDAQLATILLDNGAAINAKDQWLATPLYMAAGRCHQSLEKNNFSTINLLMVRGAHINVECRYSTPLQEADEELLLKHICGNAIYLPPYDPELNSPAILLSSIWSLQQLGVVKDIRFMILCSIDEFRRHMVNVLARRLANGASIPDKLNCFIESELIRLTRQKILNVIRNNRPGCLKNDEALLPFTIYLEDTLPKTIPARIHSKGPVFSNFEENELLDEIIDDRQDEVTGFRYRTHVIIGLGALGTIAVVWLAKKFLGTKQTVTTVEDISKDSITTEDTA